jgi:regulatory protein YycH of two-component signal transduction system YycFG
MNRILCSAIVDEMNVTNIKNGLKQFMVEVWGEKPFDYRRLYTIDAKSDNNAAQEGIRRFVEEMEALDAQELS